MEHLTLSLAIIIGASIIYVMFNTVIKFLKSCFLTLNYTNYIAILQYHMEKAYNIVHKDKILVFSLEGLRPREEDIEAIAKDFANLTIQLLGNKFYTELTEFYGSDESLFKNLFEYFNTRFEDDEIREATVDKLTESEPEEPTNERPT
jgi:hypothetical protein